MTKIYVCGPTVYDQVHIGNLKPIITFDIFTRALKVLKKPVKLIHNITDIDDKIINKAILEKVSEETIANKYYDHYLKMLKLYNVTSYDHLPRVTNYLPEIINFIKMLIVKDVAYESEQNVFFDVTKIASYGSISQNSLDKLISQNNKLKKHPADFALWKKTDQGLTWDSPWGKGRPGWHTECAFFVKHFFNGESLDYHGGGIDLIFPHHENENVQFFALFNKAIAKKFIHTGLFQMAGEKMAKSVGNIIKAQDFAQKYGEDTLRMIILNSSLSAPIELNSIIINDAKKFVDKLKRAFIQAQLLVAKEAKKIIYETRTDIFSAFATWEFAKGMKNLHQLLKDFNHEATFFKASKLIFVLENIGFNFAMKKLLKSQIDLFNNWEKARQNKDYQKADQLRKKLQIQKLI